MWSKQKTVTIVSISWKWQNIQTGYFYLIWTDFYFHSTVLLLSEQFLRLYSPFVHCRRDQKLKTGFFKTTSPIDHAVLYFSSCFSVRRNDASKIWFQSRFRLKMNVCFFKLNRSFENAFQAWKFLSPLLQFFERPIKLCLLPKLARFLLLYCLLCYVDWTESRIGFETCR